MKPLVTFLAIPLIIITLGVAFFFVNLLMLTTTAWLVDGFTIDGFWTAVGGTIVIWIVNSLLAIPVRPRRPQRPPPPGPRGASRMSSGARGHDHPGGSVTPLSDHGRPDSSGPETSRASGPGPVGHPGHLAQRGPAATARRAPL